MRHLLTTVTAMLLLTGCGDPPTYSDAGAQGCTPGASQACTCESGASGAQICDDSGAQFDRCLCDASAGSRPPNRDACDASDGEYICTDQNTGASCRENGGDCACDCYTYEPEPEPRGIYRIVLLDDLTDPVQEGTPGIDIDSVGLIKASGRHVYADTVEDFEDFSGLHNDAADPIAVLGPPDANCVAANTDRFYSVGGLGSYVMVAFGPDTVENGDTLDVVELGSTECGMFDDEPYAVGVSASTGNGTFIQVGTDTRGSALIPISGLP